ncbi:MAG: TonB-dependent receptor plug domain-containing protein [Bacteroidota bacterium]|nr:TonB-dependent receptor plug domain-containing protein [Bacteroidota bacterium]
MKKTIFLIACQFVITWSFAQSDSTITSKKDSVSIDEMSLEDLMNVPIISASREKEDAFDAPVTSYVITRQEIEKAGSTSIPEALRLCPALFVTEISNGTYDVNIRGLNNAPAFDYAISSKSLLVMIDNRPVFNQLQGGTFWTNLPVDINDIERIEVVAGPSAALYGPNAATGVINIITRRLEKDGFYAYTNSMYDAVTNSAITNGSLGYKIGKFSAIVSGNYNNRRRFVNDYFNTGTNSYENYDDAFKQTQGSIFDKSKLYPNPSQSIDKKGANIFLSYKASDKAKFELDGGINQTNPLSMIAIGIGPTLGYFNANSMNIRARADVYGFTFQASNVNGRQAFLGGIKPYQYDNSTTDFYLDYTYKFKNLLSFRPAISYQDAFITDLPYKDKSITDGIFNGSGNMYNYSGSLKLETTPFKWIRAVAAFRGDRFRYPADKTYLSYEFVLNLKPGENHNIRLVASRAYQGSYIFPTFVDFQNTAVSRFSANKNLDPAKIDLLEAGYRIKITESINADLSLFHQEGTGYYQLLATNWGLIPQGTTLGIRFDLVPTNLDLKTVQNGVTFSLNSVFLANKIQFKPFITLQQTQWLNYSPYQNSPNPLLALVGVPDNLNSKTQYNINSKATPSFYGGFFLNANPITKLNININGYVFDTYSLYGINEQPSSQPSAGSKYAPGANFIPSNASEINAKFMLNAKVSYEVVDKCKVFVNGRNILNNRNREFYGSDQIGAMYMVGINFEY